jgi:uncharacterized protein YciI
MGGCAKNGDKMDKGKDGKDGSNLAGVGLLGMGTVDSGFNISPEKRLFLVKMTGNPVGEPPTEVIEAHLQHLQQLTTDGKLDSCGAAKVGDSGFKILIAEDLKEASTLAGDDPLLTYGYYNDFELSEILFPK